MGASSLAAPALVPRTGDRAADTGFRSVDEARAMLAKVCPMLDGRRVDGVVCPASGTVRVAHGLGRVPVYAFPVWCESGAWLASVEADADYLTVTSSSAAVVDLWVA